MQSAKAAFDLFFQPSAMYHAENVDIHSVGVGKYGFVARLSVGDYSRLFLFDAAGDPVAYLSDISQAPAAAKLNNIAILSVH